MDLISVIVPIYKVEQYLNRCVESLVNQTYHNLQIILVDDGSPDNCPAMCDAWAEKDNRIKVIHKDNGGLSDARNAGMEVATGEYTGFVDSDDWVDLDFYEKLIGSMKENNADLVASDVIWEFDDHQERHKRYNQTVFTSEQALETLLQGNGFHATAWNKLYRTDVIRKFPYPVGRFHEDEFVTYKVIANADCLVLCQNTAYHYRQRQGSIMDSISEKHLDAIDAYLERLNFLEVNYRRLYLSDKPMLCMMLVGYYKNVLRGKDKENSCQIEHRLRQYRRNVHYSYSDLRTYSLKQKIYVIGTGINLGLFSKLILKRG
jgi:glycosyltransferase involved in cell wall biosynthesis